MPEHLRALVVIIAIALAVFALAQRPLCAAAMLPADFRRRRNLWFAITLIGFLSHNFWLYVLLTAGLLLVTAHRERNPIALYCVLLFAMPPYHNPVPGFGLINYVVDLNHVRLLNLAILLPAAWRLLNEPADPRSSSRLPDWLVGGFLLYQWTMHAMVDSLTGNMRTTFYLLVDVWLPYYVVSRSLRDMASFRDVVAGFILALSVMAVIGLFEMLKSWLLYASVRSSLGLPTPSIPVYITRGVGGLLRANAAVANSIVLGYVMAVGLALMIFLAPALKPKAMRWLAVACLGAGLVAALSRGPWVGAAIALVAGVAIGPGAGSRLAKIGLAGAAGFGLLLVSPWGESILDLLPFVGTVDEQNVTYRQRLFEVSMLVIAQNPLFGAFDYILHPAMEQMRQGQGIIDIVNSYLGYALAYGLVGLALFLAPFAYALAAVWRAHRRVAALDAEADRLGRALIAALVGVLVIIATVSSISVVPVVYWLVAAMCVAYACRLVPSMRPADGVQPASAAVRSHRRESWT